MIEYTDLNWAWDRSLETNKSGKIVKNNTQCTVYQKNQEISFGNLQLHINSKLKSTSVIKVKILGHYRRQNIDDFFINIKNDIEVNILKEIFVHLVRKELHLDKFLDSEGPIMELIIEGGCPIISREGKEIGDSILIDFSNEIVEIKDFQLDSYMAKIPCEIRPIFTINIENRMIKSYAIEENIRINIDYDTREYLAEWGKNKDIMNKINHINSIIDGESELIDLEGNKMFIDDDFIPMYINHIKCDGENVYWSREPAKKIVLDNTDYNMRKLIWCFDENWIEGEGDVLEYRELSRINGNWHHVLNNLDSIGTFEEWKMKEMSAIEKHSFPIKKYYIDGFNKIKEEVIEGKKIIEKNYWNYNNLELNAEIIIQDWVSGKEQSIKKSFRLKNREESSTKNTKKWLDKNIRKLWLVENLPTNDLELEINDFFIQNFVKPYKNWLEENNYVEELDEIKLDYFGNPNKPYCWPFQYMIVNPEDYE